MDKTNKSLIAIYLIAVILRIAYIIWLASFEITNDSVEYDRIARNLLHGNGYSIAFTSPFDPTMKREPIYPFFLAFVYAIHNYSAIPIYLWQAVLLSSVPVFIYLIGQALFNNTSVARLGAILTAFHFALIARSGYLLTEGITTFLLSLIILLSIHAARRQSVKYFLAIGVLVGLSALSRSSMILFPLFLIPALYITERKNVLINSNYTCIRNYAALFITFCIIITPWLLRNYIVF